MTFEGKKISFLLLSIIAISVATAYFVLNNDPVENNQQENTPSFINLGQKSNDLKHNKYSNLNADELTTKANSIISKADLLVRSSSFKSTPMSVEQKKQVDNEILKLEQQIKTLEKKLSINK